MIQNQHRTITTLALVAVLVLGTGAVRGEAGSWPMFLGSPTHATIVRSNLAPPLVQRWIFDAEGAIYSSPAVKGGRVYFATLPGRMLALDTKTGQPVWNFDADSEISTSPAVVNESVYFGSKGGRLFSLNKENGEPNWSIEVEGKITASPVVDRGVLYFGSHDMYLRAVRADNGSLIWETRLPTRTRNSGIYSTPAVAGDRIYVAEKAHNLYAIDSRNGEVVWQYTTGSAVYSSPVVKDGTVFIGGYDRTIHALDAESGKLKWKHTLDEWIYASPVVFEDALYVASKDGLLTAFDVRNGKQRWLLDLRGPISSTLAVTQEGIGYVGNEEGEMFGIDLRKGRIIWKEILPGDGFHASPALVSDTLYAGTMNGYFIAWTGKGETK